MGVCGRGAVPQGSLGNCERPDGDEAREAVAGLDQPMDCPWRALTAHLPAVARAGGMGILRSGPLRQLKHARECARLGLAPNRQSTTMPAAIQPPLQICRPCHSRAQIAQASPATYGLA